MKEIEIKPLESSFLKKALKESWLMIKSHWVALTLSILLMMGLTFTLWDYLGFQTSWMGFIGMFQAFYVAQLMILMRVTNKRGLDLIVETLIQIPKMMYLFIVTAKKSAITTSILFVGLLLSSQYFDTHGSSILILYSDFILFFGIYIGLLESSLILFVVAHQQANDYESEEYVGMIMRGVKRRGNWPLFKKFVWLSMLFIFLCSFIKIGPAVLISCYVLGLMYSSILYQMINKPKRRIFVMVELENENKLDRNSVIS